MKIQFNSANPVEAYLAGSIFHFLNGIKTEIDGVLKGLAPDSEYRLEIAPELAAKAPPRQAATPPARDEAPKKSQRDLIREAIGDGPKTADQVIAFVQREQSSAPRGSIQTQLMQLSKMGEIELAANGIWSKQN